MTGINLSFSYLNVYACSRIVICYFCCIDVIRHGHRRPNESLQDHFNRLLSYFYDGSVSVETLG